MGVVYLADDIGLDRLVAMKFLDDRIARDPGAVDSFRQEARALASLRHEHVVSIHAIGEHRGRSYFVMEFVRGKNLDEILMEHASHRDRVPVARSLAILTQVASGLGAVHKRGLVHRDVKPSNIVVEEDSGRPVLIDFGLAKVKGGAHASGPIAGTPLYMAPEQCDDSEAALIVGPQADIYSFGCAAFELLAGEPLFKGKTWPELRRQHMLEPPRPLSRVRPELACFDRALLRAVAKDPEDRYPSVLEFSQDLQSAAGNLVARVHSLVPRAPRPSTQPPVPARHVLIVDDDEQFSRFAAAAVKVGLAGHAFEITQTSSPLEALDRFDHTPADLILLDYDMPKLDGADLLNMVRLMPGGTSARVVVMSAHDEREYEWRFAALGVRDFVKKPIDFRKLARIVADVAQRSEWKRRRAS